MKKFYTFLSLFVLFSLLLVACGASQSENGTPNPYAGPTSGVESTGEPGTLPSTGQNITSTITETTELPTSPAAISSPVPSAASTQTVTSTQGVPNTGATSQGADPGLLSNQMQFQLLDQQNQPLGQVKDIVLDLTNLKVAYLIVGLSQTGTTAKQVAVPWSMVELQAATSANTSNTSSNSTPSATEQANSSQGSSSQGAFVYKGDQQLLANAPEFSADSLPQLGQPAGNWDASILSYWNGGGASSAVMTPTVSASSSATETPSASSGTQVVGQPSSGTGLQGVALASKVVGVSIMDSSNQEVAKVSDAVVDVNSGDITYVVLNADNKLIPVPPQELGLDMQTQSVVIQAGSQALQSAPSFDQGNFPQTTTPGWEDQIKSFWQSHMQPTKQP